MVKLPLTTVLRYAAQDVPPKSVDSELLLMVELRKGTF